MGIIFLSYNFYFFDKLKAPYEKELRFVEKGTFVIQ